MFCVVNSGKSGRLFNSYTKSNSRPVRFTAEFEFALRRKATLLKRRNSVSDYPFLIQLAT
jgi:hypothetical protein